MKVILFIFILYGDGSFIHSREFASAPACEAAAARARSVTEARRWKESVVQAFCTEAK